ncbi:MAG TPA: tyrosine-type recombinase/integrase [Blastocatellia bacterium]|nr:tyrosine-type recombinase/integrase [Blastocatellia bacterium]
MTEPIRVLKAVQEFLAFCAARNDSPNTIRAYNCDLLSFVQCIGHETEVREITRKRIRLYVFSLDASLKRTTVKRKIASVRSFCNWLVQECYLDSSPCEGISGPRNHHVLPDVPSEADMAKLLNGRIKSACPERDRVILELLYSCGLRASEVAGVNVDDFRLDNTLLIRGKGKKERLVPVGRQAQLAIAEWLPARKKLIAEMELETSGLLFSIGPRESTERLDVRSIRRILQAIAVSKNLPAYHPHQLRHACATHMHDHGAPIQAVAAMLGHARLSTAQIYTRVSPVRMLDVYRKAHPHATAKKRL